MSPQNEKILNTSKQIKKKKFLKGRAINNSHHKTVRVLVDFLKIHPIYKKRYFSGIKILAHTQEDVKKDQQVLIEPTRPISRRKAWRVIKIIK